MDYQLMDTVVRKQSSSFMKMLMRFTNDDKQLSEDIFQDAIIKILLWNGDVQTERHLAILMVKTIKQLLHNKSRITAIRKKIEKSLHHDEPICYQNESKIDCYPYATRIINGISNLHETKQAIIKGIFFEGLDMYGVEEKYGIKAACVHETKRKALNQLNRPVIGRHALLDERTVKIYDLREKGYDWPAISGIIGLPPKNCEGRYWNYKSQMKKKTLKKQIC